MKPKKKRRPTAKARAATAAIVARRVEDVLRIRLDGAEFWDVREFAREKEQEKGSAWELKSGRKPLSDGQLWRYIGRSNRMIAESCRSTTKKLMRRHLAQRRNLYAKAVSQGDIRTALAVVHDEAELLDLYPSTRHEVTTRTDQPLTVHYVDDFYPAVERGVSAEAVGAPTADPDSPSQV